MTIQPEDLIPKLPSPKDLQPFPTTLAVVYEGHTDMVRTVSVDTKGQFIISGSDDGTVKGVLTQLFFVFLFLFSVFRVLLF